LRQINDNDYDDYDAYELAEFVARPKIFPLKSITCIDDVIWRRNNVIISKQLPPYLEFHDFYKTSENQRSPN